MTLIVEPGDPAAPQTTALLEASHALMQSLFSDEDNHFLSIDALKAPHIHFFIAREGTAIMGCGALSHRNPATAKSNPCL
jgi:putative acetyltransferase